MDSWGYWLAAAVGLGMLVAVVLWWRSAEPPAPVSLAQPPPPRPVLPRQHAYGRCPGCWEEVVRALCTDGAVRIFDAAPIPIGDEDPQPAALDGEPTTSTVERVQRSVREAQRLNDQVWVFDPNAGPAMRRLVPDPAPGQPPAQPRRVPHVRGGHALALHLCALGRRWLTDEAQWGEPLPWRLNGER